jgi:predicted HicB family RNase H-like nuclease
MELSDRYSYRVFWSEEDGEHVAVCAELPGLSWLDKKAERALSGVLRAAREAVELLREKGNPVPEPLLDRRYSGTFKVRIPPEVHRRLVLEAEEQKVSLNRLVSAKLSAPLERVGDDRLREPATKYRARTRSET